MSYKYILDSEHNPVPASLEEWAQWFERADRHVARTPVGDLDVSTVFLGLDHRFLRDGPPILFETMVFGLYGNEEYQRRCSTWAEAEKMHQEAVEWAGTK